jgi:hypothetical protein
LSKSLSSHVAPRVSPDLAAVSAVKASALAATPGVSLSFAMKAGNSA